MRSTIRLDNWQFSPASSPAPPAWQDITLPHTMVELPYNGFDEEEFQVTGYYRCVVFGSLEWHDKEVILEFDGVMGDARVSVNGEPITSLQGGYIPHQVAIHPYLNLGQENLIAVALDCRENPETPPYGRVVDFLGFGGLYRPARLIIRNYLHLEDLHVRTVGINEGHPGFTLGVRISPGGSLDQSHDAEGLQITLTLTSPESVPWHSEPLAIQGAGIDLSFHPPDLILWEPDRPHLYTLRVDLIAPGTTLLDRIEMRTGFREVAFTPEGFFCNGQKHFLIGLNRHQTFPYRGAAMPERIQRRDAEILRQDLGLTVVRTSHYPQDPAFLDRCDELGLFVMEEIPGWQYIGDDSWKQQSLQDLEAMIRRDRHHPSVVLWGVRINESPDDTPFYRETNALARALDPGRQTGGVRNFARSELLEDVYTFNDFSHDGSNPSLLPKHRVAPRSAPYMVTEHTGHTFPTKRYDQEERLIEHSLRHLRIINHALAMKGLAGVIGWCAFDYHTHREFGSGDRICYHGVYDAFRQPKWAAAAYSSQMPPERRPVLQPLSLFALGERNGALTMPLTILTNCDSLRIYRNEEYLGEFYPDRRSWPHLPHPPVHIQELIGTRLSAYGFSLRAQTRLKRIFGAIMEKGEKGISLLQKLQLAGIVLLRGMSLLQARRMFEAVSTGWGEPEQIWRFEGIVGNRPVLQRSFGSSRASALLVDPDDTLLEAGKPDGTRVAISLVDQYGNTMPHVSEAVQVGCTGPGHLAGPRQVSLTGGVSALWVLTTGEPGIITLTVSSLRFGVSSLRIEVRSAPDVAR